MPKSDTMTIGGCTTVMLGLCHAKHTRERTQSGLVDWGIDPGLWSPSVVNTCVPYHRPLLQAPDDNPNPRYLVCCRPSVEKQLARTKHNFHYFLTTSLLVLAIL